MPTSARGWLSWAVSVSDSYRRAYSPKLEYDGWSDKRTSDRRETAVSIIRIAERACNGNGGGKLLMAYYCEDVSWYSFTEAERAVLRRTARRFRDELRKAGFINPNPGEEDFNNA